MSASEAGEHAVLIPTFAGPVGGIVGEPLGPRRGSLILLHGLGPSARAGVNRIWTRIARDLVGLGLTVLRFDFACEGDSTPVGRDAEQGVGWRRSIDLALLREIIPWFLERSGEGELILAGSCHGGRVALEFAAADADRISQLFLVVPYLWHMEPYLREAPAEERPDNPQAIWANGPTLDTDEEVLGGFRNVLARMPVWILAGEGEDAPVLPMIPALEDAGHELELDVTPGGPLHPFGHPAQQERVQRLLVGRVARVLEPSTAPAA